VLSLYGENESLFKALCAGAQGYILKKTPSDQFLMIIDEIIEERSRMSAAIANKIISGTKRKNIASLQKLKESFDEDEFKILSFMRQGNSAAAVAELLDISLVQIQKHFFRIYGKLKEVRFVV
jgi:DNA-binding NarL/FixJ family response regulator